MKRADAAAVTAVALALVGATALTGAAWAALGMGGLLLGVGVTASGAAAVFAAIANDWDSKDGDNDR